MFCTFIVSSVRCALFEVCAWLGLVKGLVLNTEMCKNVENLENRSTLRHLSANLKIFYT